MQKVQISATQVITFADIQSKGILSNLLSGSSKQVDIKQALLNIKAHYKKHFYFEPVQSQHYQNLTALLKEFKD